MVVAEENKSHHCVKYKCVRNWVVIFFICSLNTILKKIIIFLKQFDLSVGTKDACTSARVASANIHK